VKVVALWGNYDVTTGRALFDDGKQYDFILRGERYRFYTSREFTAQQQAKFGYYDNHGFSFWSKKRSAAILSVKANVQKGVFGSVPTDEEENFFIR